MGINESMVTVPKILMVFVAALLVVGMTGGIIGKEKKARWFRKRTKMSFFTRRGVLGEVCHFGYPCTKEGYLVSAVMVTVIMAASYLILVFA